VQRARCFAWYKTSCQRPENCGLLVHAFVQAVVQDASALAAVEDVLIACAYAINTAGYPSVMQPFVGHLHWLTHQSVVREDTTMATLCACLGFHFKVMGNYDGARLLYERALLIRKQVLGPDHPSTATSLNNLAVLLQLTGDYGGARPLYERALAIREQTLGPEHPSTATSLNNLANQLQVTGDYGGARPLYERALAITKKVLGQHHPDTASSLNNLAGLLLIIGNFSEAQPLVEQALAIREQVLGPTHPDTAHSLNNLAYLLQATRNYSAAQPLNGHWQFESRHWGRSILTPPAA
jgi:tetratricopeptide (TPR) repeat protein